MRGVLGMGIGWLYVLKHPVRAFRMWLQFQEIVNSMKLDPRMLALGRSLIQKGYPPKEDKGR